MNYFNYFIKQELAELVIKDAAGIVCDFETEDYISIVLNSFCCFSAFFILEK